MESTKPARVPPKRVTGKDRLAKQICRVLAIVSVLKGRSLSMREISGRACSRLPAPGASHRSIRRDIAALLQMGHVIKGARSNGIQLYRLTHEIEHGPLGETK